MTAYEKLKLMESGHTYLYSEEMNSYRVFAELIRLIDEMKNLLADCSKFFGDYHSENELHLEIEALLKREFK